MSNDGTNNRHVCSPSQLTKDFIYGISHLVQMFFIMVYVEIIINSQEVAKKYTRKS